MIIELRRYNEIGELLIENGTTGSQAQVSYRDMVRETSITRAAVHMGVKEMGMQTRNRAHTISLWVRNECSYAYGHCGAIREVLECNKMEID